MTQLVADSAAAASTPSEAAAGAEAVITMVADDDALRAIIEGPRGVSAGIVDGACLVQMSTVSPAATLGVANTLPVGAQILDAPVLGSISEAECGSLQILVGGLPALLERMRPILSTLGSPVHVGDVGAGTAEAVANSTFLDVWRCWVSTVSLARSLGLSSGVTFDVLAATPLAAQAERRRAALETRSFPPRFSLELARKDAGSTFILGGCPRRRHEGRIRRP